MRKPIESSSKPTLWSLFSEVADVSQFESVRADDDPTIQPYSISDIFDDEVQVYHLQARRQFRTTGVDPVRANVIFVSEIQYEDLLSESSKANFELREGNKSWLRRYETNLDYFRYQTKMDQVVNAVKQTIRQSEHHELYQEIYIPIVDNNAHFFIRIVLTPEGSIEAVKLFSHKDVSAKSQTTKVKKVREHLVHSLGFAFNYPINRKDKILIEEKPSLFTTEGFRHVFAPMPIESNSARVSRAVRSNERILFRYNEDISPDIYNEALRETKITFGENDDKKKMFYSKHTPQSLRAVVYVPNNQTWFQRRANGRLYTLWCQLLYIFTLITSVITQGGRAAAETKEARRPKTNMTALWQADLRVEMTVAVTLTLLICIGIVAVASAGGAAAFFALPAIKMISAYVAAVGASLKAIVSLSLPTGLEGWSAFVAFSTSWVAEKTIFPLIWRSLKLPFRGGWEPKESSTLGWKNLFRIHTWRKRGLFVPEQKNFSVLYDDMRDNFQSTKGTFFPLFNFIHSQYKRYTVAGARIARYEEELAYWARLRRKMREGKIDQVTRVLHYYVNKRQRYVDSMTQYLMPKIGKQRWEKINQTLALNIGGAALVEDHRMTEQVLRQHLLASKKNILCLLNARSSEVQIPGGESLPPYSANELYDNFCEWWLEAKRLETLSDCLKKIDDDVVIASGQYSLQETCQRERYAAKLQKRAAHQGKQHKADSYVRISTSGLGDSLLEGYIESDVKAPDEEALPDLSTVSSIAPETSAHYTQVSRYSTFSRLERADQMIQENEVFDDSAADRLAHRVKALRTSHRANRSDLSVYFHRG